MPVVLVPSPQSHLNLTRCDLPLGVHRRGRLADDMQLFFVGREVNEISRLVCHVWLHLDPPGGEGGQLLDDVAGDHLTRGDDQLSLLFGDVLTSRTAGDVRVV